ncbi:MAG: right-handed parallel beta-helix repeat-containing protein [Desulfomonilaceae bacterium]
MKLIRTAICRVLLAFIISCLGLFTSWATVYHVDINSGNDSFPGTQDKPFRSIVQASKIMQPGDKALIHKGIYHEQIMGGKSGLPDSPITYEGVDRDTVILRGSVTVTDWKKVGKVWFKVGLKPITGRNAFVLVDDQQRLTRVEEPHNMPEGSFCLDSANNYFVRLRGDADPNLHHVVDLYELDLGFNAGARWGNGTAKKYIILRNMTLEKYGAYGVSAAPDQHEQNGHWELDNLKVQLNNGAGVFCALDDWCIHNCQFLKNAIHGCQVDGSNVRFVDNVADENEFFGPSGYGGAGLLIGPDPWANSCEVKGNSFKDNGAPDGYGCAIYLEGRSHNNIVENNFIRGGTHAGICFYGSSANKVFNNILVDIAPKNTWELCAAFVISHSREGAPTQSTSNLVAYNTVYKCASPIALSDPTSPVRQGEMNEFVDNVFSYCRRMLPKPSAPVAILRNNGWFSCPEQTTKTSADFEKKLKRIYENKLISGVNSMDSNPLKGENPQFENAQHENFMPLKNSPLVNKAVPLDFVKKDYCGNARSATVPDLGACEQGHQELK